VKLAQKLNSLYSAYAKSLHLKDEFLMAFNAEYASLTEVLMSVHSAYLQSSDIDKLVLRDLIYAEIQFKGRAGLLAAEENVDIREFVVERLRTTFSSFPRKYELRIELPDFPSAGEYEVEICEGLKLCAAKHTFHLHDPQLNRLVAALHTSGEPKELKTFLLFEFEGYASANASSPVIDECMSRLKQLIFVLSAKGAWSKSFGQTKQARATLVTLGMDSNARVELPHEIARMCGQLTANPDSLKVADESSGKGISALFLGGQERLAVNDEERASAIMKKTYEATRFFAQSTHEDFPSIAAAMEWYQDSISSNNQTFGYLAACIGLESLFGSDDQLEMMSKRLEDRYAFSMGEGRSERERLRMKYRDVLNLRGKIVHAREPRLKASYQSTLREAQTMLLEATWKELHNLYRQQ